MGFDEVKQIIEEFFNGKFEVKKFLGEGSFAKVYLVRHNYLNTLMAMKIVKEPLSATTNKKAVFQEVSLACQLRHENIISIYDAAEITDFEDGKSHAYFLMEYVSGGDLERFLNSFIDNGMFMPVERALDLIRQILKGLNTLHSANPPIVHRDLKPNNVLLNFNAYGDIIIKISDFGFAKQVTTGISDIDIAGTRPYMAPELFRKNVSARSDIYAVGVIFYQLLTNRYPHDIERYTNDELMDLMPWNENPKAPSHYNDKVSENLDRIVLKCLEADSMERYEDANDLLADVEKAIDNYQSAQIISETNFDEYVDEYDDQVMNDSIEEAFKLAKCENGLDDAIEILEREVLQDYDVRKYYSETLRIWKSKNPDLKLISKAFTVNLKGKNYELACNLLREAIAYNPSLKNKYQDYIDLWEIFIDLAKHKSLFKAVESLEGLIQSSSQLDNIYRDILPILKTCSVEEIVAEATRLADDNSLYAAACLMEFAVAINSQIRERYAYRMSMWKQNMKMNYRYCDEIKKNAVDYAIDLGTTDSLVAYFNNGNPIIVKNHMTGDNFTPSAVMIDGDDNIHVGAMAKDALLENDRNATSEFKRNMGFSVPFTFEKSSRVMLPEDLSAEVLKELRVSVFDEMGVNIEHAVICVPANSNPIKTRAVNDACELAGFRSHSFILEPIAVSLAYDLRKDNGTWMIYDMGGGTFDVTLIHDNGGEIEELATDGVENFGGNTFDWKIVNDLFKPKIAEDLNLDDFRRNNPKYFHVFAKLKNAAESAKKDLNELDFTDICINNLLDDYDFNYTLNRIELKQIMEPLLNYTFNLSRNLLNENKLEEDDIDKIILVGGSTLSPIFKELIRNEFDIEIESRLDPLTVVAMGAAIHAGSIEKPDVEIANDDFSVILNHQRGRVFSHDLKSSFLGYFIEFEDGSSSTKIPLNIDGTFRLKDISKRCIINLYNGKTHVGLDERSPSRIDDGNIYIPYLDDKFPISCDSDIGELMNRYAELVRQIDYLNQYSSFSHVEIQSYVELLLEIARRDVLAINQAEIYISHLEDLVCDAKRDLEFSILLENVSNKMRIAEENDLFETGSIDGIIESRNLEKLKAFYISLIEKYVELNRNEVIEECFFNLKLNGIFTDNEDFAADLIEKAHHALSLNDYDELLDIVNILYEIDENHG